MKKTVKAIFAFLLLTSLIFSMLSCDTSTSENQSASNNANKVQHLSDRSIQHNDDVGYFTLLFSLKDSSNTRIKAPATVDIKIVNDNGDTVYAATKAIDENDFGTWTSGLYGERLLASIKIYDNEIVAGKVDSGNIYFTIYNSEHFSFNESTLSVENLPVMETTVNIPVLPKIIYDYAWDNDVTSKVKITEITYEVNGNSLDIYFTGEKTYDVEGNKYSRSCKVGWKLYDSDGYIVESGIFYSPQIVVGEKFRNEKEYAYNVIKPGETYTLEISNVD